MDEQFHIIHTTLLTAVILVDEVMAFQGNQPNHGRLFLFLVAPGSLEEWAHFVTKIAGS